MSGAFFVSFAGGNCRGNFGQYSLNSPNIKLLGSEKNLLEVAVFPSTFRSISCLPTDDFYSGAHDYGLRKMVAFADGQPQYLAGHDTQRITFVKREQDGTWRPSVQPEQLLHMLKDRHEKLNGCFPSDDHAQFVAGIDMALDALERRVRERTERGVMGTQQK